MKFTRNLTLGISLTLGALVTASSVTIYFITKQNRSIEFENNLTSNCHQLTTVYSLARATESEPLHEAMYAHLNDHSVAYSVLDLQKGAPVYRSLWAEEMHLPFSSMVEHVRIGNLFFEENGLKGTLLRFRYGDTNLLAVVTGEDLEGKVFLRTLLLTLILITIAVFGLICIVIYRFLHRSIRPLEEVIHQIKDLSAKSLDYRITVGPAPKEIRLLVHALNEVLERLENAFISQKSFIGSAGHELRTPLTAISGQIQLTLQKERTEEEYVQALGSIDEELGKLVRLTNALLSFAQINGANPNKGEWAVIRIDEVVLSAIEEYHSYGKKCDVELELLDNHEELEVDDITVYANEQLLITAFVNLISNACKYSAYKPISIHVLKSGDFVVVLVMDDGVGIDEGDIEYIFKPFYKPKSTHHAKGIGLGLPLTKRIIEIHDGEIHIASKEGRGTTVKVCIPIHKPK